VDGGYEDRSMVSPQRRRQLVASLVPVVESLNRNVAKIAAIESAAECSATAACCVASR
jgi:hypothetical protein